MPTSVPVPAVTLVLGDEDLLVSRAVATVVGVVRALDSGADVREFTGAALESAAVLDLLTPSLFGELRVLVIRGAHEVPDDARATIEQLVAEPADGVYLVVVHPGGQKGKRLVDACKAARAHVVPCAKVDKAGDRIAFVQAEVNGAGRRVTPNAARAIVDAVGGGLRELASACSQLVADTPGAIDEIAVARYFRGRADASGFVVADRAVEGDIAGALTELRLAFAAGLDPVVVVAGLARQVRMIARVATAGRAPAASVASSLKLAPWMVDKARRQARGWTADTLAAAHRAIAIADAEVKGGGTQPHFATERAVVAVATARGGSR